MTPPRTPPTAGAAAAATHAPVRLTTRAGRRVLPRLARATGAFVRCVGAVGLLGSVVAAVPYVLHRLAPDPWPEHRRSIGEIRDALLAPTTDQILLDTLAAVGWIAWAGFVLSLLVELGWYLRHLPTLMRDASAHRTHQREAGVWRAPAAWLAGLLIIALVAMMRATHTTTIAAAEHQAPATRAAAAVATLHPTGSLPAPTLLAEADKSAHDAPPAPAPPGSAGHISYTVQPGDTLWDIAAARLGDPIHWPQIYAMSRHLAQPDGGRLTDPDLIHPGWILRLPADGSPATPPPLPVPAPTAEPPKTPPAAPPTVQPPLPGTSAPAPTSAPETTPNAPAPAVPPGPQATPPAPTRGPTTPPPATEHSHDGAAGRPALDVPTVGLLGATAATGIAAAMLWARRHRRRAHPDTDSARPALPPVLSIVHRTRRGAEPADVPADEAPDGARLFGASPLLRRRPRLTAPLPPGQAAFAVRGDTEVSLDTIAAGHGIGLAGPGASGTARAIAAAVLADHERARPVSGTLTLLITDADAAALLGDDRDPHLLAELPQVRQLPDTEACLAAAEHHVLVAAHRADSDAHAPGAALLAPKPTRLVLLARTTPQYRARLAGIAAAGAADRPREPAVVVVVLGTWPVMCRISGDGAITADAHPVRQLLDGARALHLTADAFGDLADEFAAAHGQPPARPLPGIDDDMFWSDGPHGDGTDDGDAFDGTAHTVVDNAPPGDGAARGPARSVLVDPPRMRPLLGLEHYPIPSSDWPLHPWSSDQPSAAPPTDQHTAPVDAAPPDPAEPHRDHEPAAGIAVPIPVPPATTPSRSTTASPHTETASQDPAAEDTTPPSPPASAAAALPSTPLRPGPTSPPPVTVRVFGALRIDVDGAETTAGTHLHDHTREFLALLAAHPDGIRTEQLADHLDLDDGTVEPDQVTRQLTNLRRAIRRVLREATGHRQAAFVTTTGERHRLDPLLTGTDVAVFVGALDRAARAGGAEARAAAWEQAVAAYTGDLLDGADYPWADLPREHLKVRAVDAATRLADHHAAEGRVDRALALLDWATSRDPYNEALYQRAMRLQLAAGRDDAVHRTFDRLVARLAELDTAPDSATQALLVAGPGRPRPSTPRQR